MSPHNLSFWIAIVSGDIQTRMHSNAAYQYKPSALELSMLSRWLDQLQHPSHLSSQQYYSELAISMPRVASGE